MFVSSPDNRCKKNSSEVGEFTAAEKAISDRPAQRWYNHLPHSLSQLMDRATSWASLVSLGSSMTSRHRQQTLASTEVTLTWMVSLSSDSASFFLVPLVDLYCIILRDSFRDLSTLAPSLLESHYGYCRTTLGLLAIIDHSITLSITIQWYRTRNPTIRVVSSYPHKKGKSRVKRLFTAHYFQTKAITWLFCLYHILQ